MSYVPNFIPSDEPCVIPIFSEKRSRLLKNGLFVRSLSQGEQTNNISIACFLGATTDNSTHTHQNIEIRIYINDEQVEVFSAIQNKLINADDYGATGFINIRAALNGHSVWIESTARGTDVEDIVSIDPNDVIGFERTSLAGGSGGPSDGAAIALIRTGPESTLIGIKSSENEVGAMVSPSPTTRTQKWDGSDWVSA